MQAVKWVVAKLQGDKHASFCREMSWSRSYREINQHSSLPWNFITHGFLDPSAFPERRMSHTCVRICCKIDSEKGAGYVYLIRIDGAQNCPRL